MINNDMMIPSEYQYTDGNAQVMVVESTWGKRGEVASAKWAERKRRCIYRRLSNESDLCFQDREQFHNGGYGKSYPKYHDGHVESVFPWIER